MRVLVRELLACHERSNCVVHFLLRGPNVLEIHGLSVISGAERLGGKINVHRASDRIRHHQRRACQVIRLHILVNARFKVAIAGEDAGHHQVAILDCLADMVRQRSAVTDARGASVADEIEAKVLERLEKTTLY